MPNANDNQRDKHSGSSREDNGDMTVRDAGEKGGQRVHERVEEGKEKKATLEAAAARTAERKRRPARPAG